MGSKDRGNRSCIGLISATQVEGVSLEKTIRQGRLAAISQLRILTGTMWGRTVIYVVSGIGKTNASHAATVLIRNYAPAYIINFGIGGAYPSSGLAVCDLAIAEKEIYGDEGVSDSSGFHDTEFMGIPLLRKGGKRYFNEFPLDRKLRQKALQTSHGIAPVLAGTFLTVSSCTGTRKKAMELTRQFHPLCENMEGAAVAHICTLYGIPMAEIRGISNLVGERDRSAWEIRGAAETAQRAVKELFNVL